jgi:hypothetical protein
MTVTSSSAPLRKARNCFLLALNQQWYFSSPTFSIQSLVSPSSYSWMAMCVVAGAPATG